METLELPSIEKVKRKEKILRMVDIYIYLQKYAWIQYNKKFIRNVIWPPTSQSAINPLAILAKYEYK